MLTVTIQKREEKKNESFSRVVSLWGRLIALTVNTNGTVVTNSNMKWNERICCQMFPCGCDRKKEAETMKKLRDERPKKKFIGLTWAVQVQVNLPCIQDMWVVMLRLMISTLESTVLPIVRSVDSHIEWHPNLWLVVPETLLPSTLPTLKIRFYFRLCIHNCSHGKSMWNERNGDSQNGKSVSEESMGNILVARLTNAHRSDLNRLRLV